jgi:hypothetical protein
LNRLNAFIGLIHLIAIKIPPIKPITHPVAVVPKPKSLSEATQRPTNHPSQLQIGTPMTATNILAEVVTARTLTQ